MTFAEIMAWALWPIIGIFVVLLTATRGTKLQWTSLRLYIVWAACGTFFVYLALEILYHQTSIVWVTDNFVLIGMFGLLAIGKLLLPGSNAGSPPLSKARFIGYLLFGVVLLWLSANTLYSDYAEPRLVLEGQVHNVREKRGYRNVEYLAEIGGHTVNATTPVFERLKSEPYVRVEVGRGSNYIFNIEYLKNQGNDW